MRFRRAGRHDACVQQQHHLLSVDVIGFRGRWLAASMVDGLID